MAKGMSFLPTDWEQLGEIELGHLATQCFASKEQEALDAVNKRRAELREKVAHAPTEPAPAKGKAK